MPRLSTLGLITTSALAVALLAAFATACGSGSSARTRGGVTIEPLVSATAATAPTGGKPAAPTPSPGGDAPSATQAPDVIATPAPPPASDGTAAPVEGRWIDVDVTNFVVRLMDGASVTREISPVAVGEQIDTGEYASTQTGLFNVNSKIEDLAYDPPYGTYISHWVGFDLDKANGFHSFLKDKDGAVVDARTGRISNGCIRTGAPEAVFAFAEIGMPVWVHH
jgi:hypothetical protein